MELDAANNCKDQRWPPNRLLNGTTCIFHTLLFWYFILLAVALSDRGVTVKKPQYYTN